MITACRWRSRPRYLGCRGQELAEYAAVTFLGVIGVVVCIGGFESAILKLYRTSASLVAMNFP